MTMMYALLICPDWRRIAEGYLARRSRKCACHAKLYSDAVTGCCHATLPLFCATMRGREWDTGDCRVLCAALSGRDTDVCQFLCVTLRGLDVGVRRVYCAAPVAHRDISICRLSVLEARAGHRRLPVLLRCAARTGHRYLSGLLRCADWVLVLLDM